jgi:cysteinyl-tRNA synthetase
MSQKYLGDTIDIHGGGQDLIFPHHENEIAQTEGVTDKTFSNYWVHNGYININNEKMSKSKGNFFTVRDISQEIDLEVVRFFMLSAHYRHPINFSKDLLEQSNTALNRLYNTRDNLLFLLEKAKDNNNEIEPWALKLPKYKEAFKDAMEDDINTAEAIAVIFELIKEINTNTNEKSNKVTVKASLDFFTELTGVLGIVTKKEEKLLDVEIEEMIERRQIARSQKDFALSDQIRDELKDKGIVLEDTREGVKWKRI